MLEKILTIIFKMIGEYLIKKGKKEIEISQKKGEVRKRNTRYSEKVRLIAGDPNLTDEEKNEKLKRLGREYAANSRV